MNKIKIEGRTIYIAKYHDEKLAMQACNREPKRWLVLGDIDDAWGRFWVVRPVDATRLARAGYEIA